jgi:hypothetical protein
MNHPEVVDRLAILDAAHPRKLSKGLIHPGQLKRSWYFCGSGRGIDTRTGPSRRCCAWRFNDSHGGGGSSGTAGLVRDR